MKTTTLLALMGMASNILAAPTGNELLPFYEGGDCSGGFFEECMGTLAFCKTRDEEACLQQRKAPPIKVSDDTGLVQKRMPKTERENSVGL
ncbi:hypothetical protein CDD81_1404 [Ophiocordyceps australis]|uniref:Uncharacterized protein n=1 Tax=Ophiocordyceps australis TaxID=1399860 RepID=A0A2C5Y0X1_9HYPO|nr:hypothetical protein CDD81_1404 [Ophiocordyceps australis]